MPSVNLARSDTYSEFPNDEKLLPNQYQATSIKHPHFHSSFVIYSIVIPSPHHPIHRHP